MIARRIRENAPSRELLPSNIYAMANVTRMTVTRAAQELHLPPATLKDFERRGLVGPFERDSAGRRLLTAADVAAVRQFLEAREALRHE